MFSTHKRFGRVKLTPIISWAIVIASSRIALSTIDLTDREAKNSIKRVVMQVKRRLGPVVLGLFVIAVIALFIRDASVFRNGSESVQAAPSSARIGLDDPIPRPIYKRNVTVILRTVATGLTAPNWGTFAPGGNPIKLYVTDQTGTLWSINVVTGSKSIFLDVSNRLVDLFVFDERGLLGVAFHPDYGANGLLYTYTSEPVDGAADFSTMPDGIQADHQSVVAEWRVIDPQAADSVVDPSTRREILRVDQPQSNHNGGALNFGPDGMLYISFGDGGGGDDQGTGHGDNGNGQDAGNVLGAILRIDPLSSGSANGQYGIPDDNPFVGQPDFVDEVFAYGFRNPFRFSFDSATGNMYVADVGQNDIEEIDIGVSGGNFGWNHKEGTFFFDDNGPGPGFVTDIDPGVPPGLIDPVAQYDHDEGVAVIGGFVYRGRRNSVLRGRYIFGEFSRTINDGRLFYFVWPNWTGRNRIAELRIFGRENLGKSLLGFGQDARGEIYVLANDFGLPSGETGVVLKIAFAAQFPRD